MNLKDICRDYIAPLLAGAITGWSVFQPAWAPLQIPALLLLAYPLMRSSGTVAGLRPGLLFGTSMACLVLISVKLPSLTIAILFSTASIYWMLLGRGLSFFLQLRSLNGALAAAGLVAISERAQSSLIPLFGTAQRIACGWVEHAVVLPISRLGGTTLIALFVCSASFLLAQLSFRRDSDLRKQKAALLALVSMLIVPNWCFEFERSDRTLKIALIGARSSAFAMADPARFLESYGPLVEQVAAQGAQLIVTPELGMSLQAPDTDSILMRLAEKAKKLGVTWAIGFAQAAPSLNRAALLNIQEALVSPAYDKTFWVPEIERYDRRGDGGIVTGTMVDGTKVGLMICQDDNYETISRQLSLAGVQLAAVPTMDWKGVEQAHLNNARNRPREFGFVEARAAIGGISAVIDTDGRVIASRNHLAEGDGWVIAEVRVPAGKPTMFARYGDIPALVLCGVFVCLGLRERFRRRTGCSQTSNDEDSGVSKPALTDCARGQSENPTIRRP